MRTAVQLACCAPLWQSRLRHANCTSSVAFVLCACWIHTHSPMDRARGLGTRKQSVQVSLDDVKHLFNTVDGSGTSSTKGSQQFAPHHRVRRKSVLARSVSMHALVLGLGKRRIDVRTCTRPCVRGLSKLWGMTDREFGARQVRLRQSTYKTGCIRCLPLIHPDSAFRVRWDLVAILLVMFTSLIVPFRVAFMPFEVNWWCVRCEHVCCVCGVTLFFITASTGCYLTFSKTCSSLWIFS